MSMSLICSSCDNDKAFLVKTLQVHVVHVEDTRIEVDDESRPAILEVLCDECEVELSFDDLDDVVRRELVLTLGSR